MSRLLDQLESVVHGTPAGYKGGCRSRGGCPNHGSRTELTCVRAHRAWVHYYRLFEALDADQPITKAMLRDAKGRA
jgi:hypothetical protein